MIFSHLRHFAFIVLLLVSRHALAAAAMPLLSDFNHKAWGALDGAPVDVMKFAQTPDGWLWIATATGLWRYDGVRFERTDKVYGNPLKSNALMGLAATKDGALIVGYQLGGVTVFRKGYSRTFSEAEGLPAGGVYHIEPAPDGSVWAGTGTGAARLPLNGNRFEPLGANVHLPTKAVYQFLFSRNGTQWVATKEGMFFRRPGEDTFSHAWPRMQLYAIGEAPDGTIWAAGGKRYYYRIHTERPRVGADDPRPEFRGRGILFDRGGVMWLLQNEGVERKLDLAASSPEQMLTPQNGLSGIVPGAIFQDREENIWVGTATGIDRLRPNRLKTVLSELPLEAPTLLHGRSGEVWIGDPENDLHSVTPDGMSRIEGPIRMTASHWDRDGALWYGYYNGLHRRSPNGEILTIAPPKGLEGRQLQAIQSDGKGSLWVSFFSSGLFKLTGSAWVLDGNLKGFPHAMTTSMVTDAQGVIWMGHANNEISLVSEDKVGTTVKRLGLKNGLNAGSVMVLYRDGDDIWVGGERGVFLYRGGSFIQLSGTHEEAFRGVSGIVKLPNGELWLNGADGIYRIGAAAIAGWLKGDNASVEFEYFGSADGLRGHAPQISPTPSLIRSPDGHLWFATSNNVATIDPSRIHRNPVPPPVVIRRVESSGTQFAVDGIKDLSLPEGSNQIAVPFTALSLSIPERVRFRYRLVGLDKEWQDPGLRREAYYTNLEPGRYRFEVNAANEDGVWNAQGAAMDIYIPPTFIQTPWFLLLMALAAALLCYGAYVLRIRVITRRLQEGFLARMAERSRIARALHDTLLQSVQYLILTFQTHTNSYAKDSNERNRLEQTLNFAEQLLVEGRDQIMDLRASSAPEDLILALEQFGKGLAEHRPHLFNATMHGRPRQLRPKVYEEIYAIAKEALFNASRYAEAKHIWLELSYESRCFTLRVGDDGRGLDEGVMKDGQRPGHWGLVGMRERANFIGAQFSIISEPGKGAEVVATLSSKAAYESRLTA
jgi:signal transduction histidine kinase/ligand-binding sensor domain-containing protein